MRSSILFTAVALSVTTASAAAPPFAPPSAPLTCHYSYMQIPLTQVDLGFDGDGQPAQFATITMQGRSHQETVTPEVIAADEVVHIWLSKESVDNSIEMVVYAKAHPEGISKLTNHHVPLGQDMWGSCN